MKKIPTLFVRNPENMKLVTDQVTPGLEHVLEGTLRPTIKFDGSACMWNYGLRQWLKRREVKKDKPIPEGFIEAGTTETKIQGWVPVGSGNEDKWFREAIDLYIDLYVVKGMHEHPTATFEAIGPKFQGGAQPVSANILCRHGWTGVNDARLEKPFTTDAIRSVLAEREIEGIVWWDDKEPVAKIKRRDFGLEWPIKQESTDAGE